MASGETHRRSPTLPKKNQEAKVAAGTSSKETDYPKEAFCVYCRTEGHVRDDCFKLKKKQNPTASSSSKPSTTISVLDQHKESSVSTTDSHPVAVVAESDGKIIEINDSKLKVASINSKPCNIWALLDTGSLISLIRPLIKKFFDSSIADSFENFQVGSRSSYKAINNTPIQISGIISTQISLQILPSFTASINLHILQDDSFSLDMIIGRDFIKDNSISVLYNPSGKELHNKIMLFQEIASTEIIEDHTHDLKSVFSSIETNFDAVVKDQFQCF